MREERPRAHARVQRERALEVSGRLRREPERDGERREVPCGRTVAADTESDDDVALGVRQQQVVDETRA
jgi:hypothetical protein